MSVVDEPFYAYYLTKTGLEHPGREEVLRSQSSNPYHVINEVLFKEYETPHVFFKNMAKHMIDLDLAYCKEMINVFLIRDPERLIASFSKVVPNMDESEIGLKASWTLYQKLNTSQNPAIILNSDVVLQNPAKALAKLCSQIRILFDTAMLTWESGPIPEDGVWAPYWYKSVHQSTGFSSSKPSTDKVPANLMPLLDEVIPYYEKLNEQSISTD